MFPSVGTIGVASANAALWTFVNRNEFDVAGEQIVLPVRAGTHYFDLWTGSSLRQ